MQCSEERPSIFDKGAEASLIQRTYHAGRNVRTMRGGTEVSFRNYEAKDHQAKSV
jgi:hypothetical protein